MKKLLKVIDDISGWAGRIASWFCITLVLVIVYDVIARYVFNAPTIWGYETAVMLGCTVYVLGWVFTHMKHGHVRIDVIYSRLSARKRAFIDVTGTFFIFSPLLIVFIAGSYSQAWHAWSIGEVALESYWYPPLAPLRTVVLVGFCLLAFQAAAQFFRDSYILIRGKPYD